jgi:hypothetical protein
MYYRYCPKHGREERFYIVHEYTYPRSCGWDICDECRLETEDLEACLMIVFYYDVGVATTTTWN